ncbi:MAG: CotH kinase family protein [Kiritimatiellae bacterium]|nr:CotH kinase family protein [Kiritimatiellia bacterium]
MFGKTTQTALRVGVLAMGAIAADAATVATPTFNKKHGFYSSSFSVAISTATSGATIRYTTDGSAPTASKGTVYGGAVPISTTTCLRAVAAKSGMTTSMSVTQTYIFPAKVLIQTRPSGYPTQWGPNSEGKMNPMEYELDAGLVSQYASTIQDDLQQVPSMSIAMHRDDLFGPKGVGVYNSGDGRSASNSLYEKSCSAELIYPNKTTFSGFAGFQINCGIRPHTHVKGKRFFKLVFRAERGPKKLYYPVFESAVHGAGSAVQAFDHLVLRAGGNDSWQHAGLSTYHATYTRDQWVRASQLEMNGYGARGTYVHLYLNGLYWGLYNLTERPDAWFAKAYDGGTKENWTALHHADDTAVYKHRLVSGDHSRWCYLHSTLAKNGGLSDASTYNQVKQYLNVTNFADTIVLHSYAGSGDWPHNNWFAGYRNAPTPEPARYFAWDLEDSWLYTREGTVEQPKPRSNEGAWIHPFLRATWPQMGKLWVEIVKNADFKMLFADRIYRHGYNEGQLTESKSLARWNAINAQIDRAIVGEAARWGTFHRHSTPNWQLADAGLTLPAKFTRSHWLARVNEVRGHMSGNSDRLVAAARSYGYYPSLNPPLYSRHGGTVAAGFKLTISKSGTGTIFYRTDGQDPRVDGGGVRSGSSAQTSSVVLTLNNTTTVKTRLKNAATWSALADAKFTVTAATPKPEIALGTTSIAVSCEQGQNAPSKTFQVWNSGGGTLLYKVEEGSSKFSVSPTTGSSTGAGDKKTHTIAFTASGLAPGVYDRSLTVQDNGSGAANGPVTIAVQITVNAPAPEPTEEIAKGAAWKYRPGSTEASAPATAWRGIRFDDSGWSSGAAPIGCGPLAYGTKLAMSGRYTSLFLRKTVQMADPAKIVELSLNVDYDDGFILWINGQELARVNVQGAPGTFVAHDATCTGYVAGSTAAWSATFKDAILPALQAENVVAVQVFNNSLYSGDAMFDLSLSVIRYSLSISEDADQDALPDVWEDAHLSDLSDPSDTSDSADPDGDGVSNLEEYIAGTSPTTDSQWFGVDAQLVGGRVVVSFVTVAASGPGYEGVSRHYALEEGMSTAGATWGVVPGYEDIVGTGQTVSYPPSGGGAGEAKIYRARVWLENL